MFKILTSLYNNSVKVTETETKTEYNIRHLEEGLMKRVLLNKCVDKKKYKKKEYLYRKCTIEKLEEGF